MPCEAIGEAPGFIRRQCQWGQGGMVEILYHSFSRKGKAGYADLGLVGLNNPSGL